jgi:hypothetical protein
MRRPTPPEGCVALETAGTAARPFWTPGLVLPVTGQWPLVRARA